jgi:hypothetical protein
MSIGDRNFDVRVHLDRVGSLHPGQTAIVPISFYDLDFARHFVGVGKKFKLRESKVIGDGVIEEVRFVA